MTDPVIPASTDSLRLKHDKAIEAGCAQCPKCEMGWLQYLIATDEFSCPQCGYSDRQPLATTEWKITHEPAQPASKTFAEHCQTGTIKYKPRHAGTLVIRNGTPE